MNTTIESNISDSLARDSDVTVSTRRTPQAEYKGFAAHVLSALFLGVWICWALFPSRVLELMGVYYYPARWWALAIPAWVLMALGYMYILVALMGTEQLTRPLEDSRSVTDDTGVIAGGRCDRKSTGVRDVPLQKVNTVLYKGIGYVS
jgi:phosphatidylinositol glycan class P protein